MESLIESYFKDGSSVVEITQLIVLDVQNLLLLIQELESRLTSLEPFVRSSAIELVSKVLSRLPSDSLNTAHGELLSSFFIEKLHDKPSVPYILASLVQLLRKDWVPIHVFSLIPDSIFTELNVQTLSQPVRYHAYEILDLIVTKTTTPLSNAFVVGFLNSVDSEKDPRNLLLAFKLFQKVVVLCSVEEHAEDLFDFVFCYFPVSFRAPTKEVLTVTAEDLKLALKDCLAASSAFAPFATPLLLEKLSASSTNAKKDTLDVLSQCLPVYGLSHFVPSLGTIWETIKTESLYSGEELLELSAMALFKILLSLFNDTLLADYSVQWMDEILLLINETETQGSRKAPLLLKTMACASPAVYRLVIHRALGPILTRLNASTTKLQDRRTLCQTLGYILQVYPLVFEQESDKDRLLDSFKEMIMSALTKSITEHSSFQILQGEGIMALSHLVMIPNILSPVQIQSAIQLLIHVVQNEKDESLNMALHSLNDIIAKYPEIVCDNVTQAFPLDFDHPKTLLVYQKVVNHGLMTQYFLNRLIQLFPDLLQDGSTILNHLKTILMAHAELKQLDSTKILKEWMEPFLINVAERNTGFSVNIYESLFNILHVGCTALTKEESSQLIHLFTKTIFKNQDLKAFTLVILLNAFSTELLAQMDTKSLVEFLVSQLKSTTLSLDYVNIGLANLVNKIMVESQVEELLFFLKNEPSLIKSYVWVLKGLIMKSSQLGYNELDYLISLLENPNLSHAVIDGISIILTEPTNGTFQMKLFYKQRFFSTILPKLLESYSKHPNEELTYIKAICSLMKEVPHHFMEKQLEMLIPIFFKALQLEDSSVLLSALYGFNLMKQESPKKLEEYIETVIPRFLKLLSKQNPLTIRLEVVKFIGDLPNVLEYSWLHPYKSSVCQVLGQTLNDHKRVVRKAAADARMKWYLM